MATKRAAVGVLLSLSVLLGAGWAGAQPGKDKREERREDRKEKREEKREERQEKRDDKKDELKEEWKKKRDEWREKRKDRREERRTELKKKWGELLEKPAARAELRIHTRRMARLERVAFLAEATGKTAVLERAKKAIEKERARHQARMEKIQKEGGK